MKLSDIILFRQFDNNAATLVKTVNVNNSKEQIASFI